MIMILFATVTSFALLYVSLFVGYLLFWFLVSLFAKQSTIDERPRMWNKFAIIIPAHNEELVIGPLLDSANRLEYGRDLYDVYVVVDNSTDGTERIVREKGARAFVRNDMTKRGKPFALNWFINKIDLTAYDAYVIIDADTTIDRMFLQVMNTKLNEGAIIIQGYFGILNPHDTWLTHLMVIPGVLKYHYRYRGKNLLGFSCPLMGNGMCFRREVFQRYGWDAFTLTENWEYYLMSLLRGYVPTYADAYIYSQTASTMKQGKTQRERWFKGKIHCARTYTPRLLLKGIATANVRYLDAAIELVMPSISMSINFIGLITLASAVQYLIWPELLPLLIWSLALGASFVSYFLFGMIAMKSPKETWFALAKAPSFLVWKFLTTLHALFHAKDQEWIKTKRQ